MKILIIYFSQTGTTKKTAELIAQGITEADPDSKCELVKMSDVDMSTLADYDLVGLGSPVWYYREPMNVQQFMHDLPDLSGKRWFIFCSHGAMIGVTLEKMKEALLKKGVEIVGYHDIFADAYPPFVPVVTITHGHPDERDYRQAVQFGRELIERARRIMSGERCEIPEPDPVDEKFQLKAELLTPFVMENYLPRLEVDLLKCTLCRTCEKTCPVGGIDIDACPPVLQNPCIYCYRCVMACPEAAIDAEDGNWLMLYDELPNLYREFRPVLEKAVSENRFKWYSDPDNLNFANTRLAQKKRERWGS